jgi:hypothetical protein
MKRNEQTDDPGSFMSNVRVPNTGEPAETGGHVPWGDISHLIREGERQRAEYAAQAVFAALGQLRLWLRAWSREARAQAAAERAARRLSQPEFAGSPARGFFWPRLSWVAQEGKRWFGLANERKADRQGRRAA